MPIRYNEREVKILKFYFIRDVNNDMSNQKRAAHGFESSNHYIILELQNQHGITVRKEPVIEPYRFTVGFHNRLISAKSCCKHE